MEKKIWLIVFIVGVVFTLASCASSEPCAAYRGSGNYKYNNNVKRPSVAGAMNRPRAKLRY